MFFVNIYFLIYVSILMSIKSESEKIIVIDSFSSVFMDSLSNEIDYDSSDMESIRISSIETKSTMDAQSQSHNSIAEITKNSKNDKCIFSIVRFFCECSIDDE